MNRIILLFLLSYPILGFSQNDKPTTFKRFGVGIGYSTYSVMSDSIRPIELSLRYRINDKHALQLYTPVSFKRTGVSRINNTRKQSLWGLGLGYDYTIYTYSSVSLFTGLSANYQWYQNRHDKYYKGPRYSIPDESYYDAEETFYNWYKVRGLTLNPNVGIRLSFGPISTEVQMNLLFSKLRKEAYSFYEEINEGARSVSETLFPENNIVELKHKANFTARFIYNF